MRRVVITGVGAVSPCGLDAPSTFDSIAAGRSGIAPITLFDASEIPSRIAGECKGFDPETVIEKKRLRESARFIHLAMAASVEAVRNAGFEPDESQKERVGTFIGVGFCGIEVFEQNHQTYLEKGARRISPYFVPATISNLAAGQVSMRFGFKGPSYCNTSACSSGGHAIGEAFEWIRRGGMDAAIAGGAEAPITPMGVGGFASMRALSKRNEEPERASRPFDKGRDGFVIAEGAAVLCLEELEHAKKRGARIYGEFAGFGQSGDGYHITAPHPEGAGGALAMKAALRSAKLNPEDIDLVNAHGTSTPLGDLGETMGVKKCFGDHARKLMMHSTKSLIGHTLGAAGAVEAVAALMALHKGIVHPTRNLHEASPECDLDYVPHVAREAKVRAVLSNSFGFGGHNATVILKAFAG